MTDISLQQRHCVPCEGGTDPLTPDQEEMYLSAVPNWELTSSDDIHFIRLEHVCINFMDAVRLLNKIAEIAESEQHHPDIKIIDYKHLEVCLTTHAIRGLSENDFIVAAKIDELLKNS